MNKFVRILTAIILAIVTCFSIVACNGTQSGQEVAYSVGIFAEEIDGTLKDITEQYAEEIGGCKGLIGETVNVKNYVVPFAPTGCELNIENSTLEGTLTADKALALRIEYKRKIYTVSFDIVGVDTQIVKYGAMATKPSNPERENFVFNGWLLYNEPFDFSKPITYNVSLTASWRSTFSAMTETDDYSSFVFGAGMEDEEGNFYSAASSDSYIKGGIEYVFPLTGTTYGVYLPLINYAAYEKVTFEWKCSVWLGCGTDPTQWNAWQEGTEGQYGTIEVSVEGDTLVVIMYHYPTFPQAPLFNSYTMLITDIDIINGNVSLSLYAHTYGYYRWFSVGMPTFQKKSV